MSPLVKFFQFIKRYKLILCLLAFLQVAILVEAAHGQLSSLSTQTPGLGGSLVKIDVVDELFNMDLSPSRNAVIIKEEGLYFVMSAAQVGATGSSTSGYVDLWLNQNGKPLYNSGCRMTITDSGWTGVLVAQTTIKLKVGDVISSSFSASGPSLGLIFMQPDNESAIPSVLFSIFKIK